MAGKKLEGKGTTEEGEEKKEETKGKEEEEEKGIVKSEEVDGALKKFKDDSESSILIDSVKDAAAGMPRAFCVLVHEQTFDCKAKAFKN